VVINLAPRSEANDGFCSVYRTLDDDCLSHQLHHRWGIFGLPGEVTRLLGRASPIAMIVAALGMAVIVACITEVGSQFSDPGGAYLYVRTVFGRFIGIQIGWFNLLVLTSVIGALANLFVNYLGTFLPWPVNTWERGSLMAILIAIPAAANYFGVRSGANLSNVMTLAKLASYSAWRALSISRR